MFFTPAKCEFDLPALCATEPIESRPGALNY